jgi:hypothetical protein
MESTAQSQLQLQASDAPDGIAVFIVTDNRHPGRLVKENEPARLGQARFIAKEYAGRARNESKKSLDAAMNTMLNALTDSVNTFSEASQKAAYASLLMRVELLRFLVALDNRTIAGRCRHLWRSFLHAISTYDGEALDWGMTEMEAQLRRAELELAEKTALRMASIDGPSVVAIANALAQSDEATDFPDRQMVVDRMEIVPPPAKR